MNMEEMDKRIMEVARNAVKEYLENLMNTERDVFLEEKGGLKNGYYERAMKTKFGEIEDLNVPRDREGRFRCKRPLKIDQNRSLKIDHPLFHEDGNVQPSLLRNGI